MTGGLGNEMIQQGRLMASTEPLKVHQRKQQNYHLPPGWVCDSTEGQVVGDFKETPK